MTVVVSAVGLVSCLGRGTEAHLDAIASTRSGITALPPLSDDDRIVRPAGIVDDSWLSDVDGRADRATRLALAACTDAFPRGVLPAGQDLERVGVLIGTGLGGMVTLDAAYARLYGEKNLRVHPMTIPLAMPNAPTSAVARMLGAKGPAFGIVSACTSGLHAIAQGAAWIRAGFADAVIAGGTDSPLAEGIVRAWDALRVLAPAGNDPSRACRPFSSDRAGLVLAEGAAVLLLEDSGAAKRNGRAPLASIDGIGMTSDAGHVTDPSADGMARALSAAVASSRIDPARLGYVSAHGTGTRANDALECEALRKTFGEKAAALMVSSTKSIHGHAMGASGAIEMAMTILALNEGLVPATAHLDQIDPACEGLDHVAREPRRVETGAFVSSSFGFGGLNAVVAGRTAAALS